jgi:hypothetical protein
MHSLTLLLMGLLEMFPQLGEAFLFCINKQTNMIIALSFYKTSCGPMFLKLLFFGDFFIFLNNETNRVNGEYLYVLAQKEYLFCYNEA